MNEQDKKMKLDKTQVNILFDMYTQCECIKVKERNIAYGYMLVEKDDFDKLKELEMLKYLCQDENAVKEKFDVYFLSDKAKHLISKEIDNLIERIENMEV